MKMKKITAMVLALALLLLSLGCGAENGESGTESSGQNGGYEETVPDDFSFALEWEFSYEKGSFDSKTGKLLKYIDVEGQSEEHDADLPMDEEDKLHIFNLISSIHVFSYPDVYDPKNEGDGQTMSLKLTVRFGEEVKTVKAENIPRSFISEDDMGHLFLDTCKEIYDIITASDEWNSLPKPPVLEI